MLLCSLTAVSIAALLGVMFFMYFVTDIPSGCGQYLLDRGLDATAYGVLSSIYGWVNSVLPLFAGLMLDHFGRSKSYIIFTACIGSGTLLFLLGTATLDAPFHFSPMAAFVVMSVGRVLFSVGGDSAVCANDTMLTALLPPAVVATSITVSILVGRVGSVVSMNAVPLLIDQVGLGPSMYVVMTLLLPFTVAVAAASILGYAATKRRKAHTRAMLMVVEEGGFLDEDVSSIDAAEYFDAADVPDMPELPAPPNSTKPVPKPVAGVPVESLDAGLLKARQTLLQRVWEAVNIPIVGVLLAIMCMPSMGFIAFGWTSVGQVILVARSGLEADVAARLVSVANLISMLSPLWAFIIDRFRKQLVLMLLSGVLSLAAFTLLLIPGSPPLLSMVLQGIAFSIASPCCWSSVPLCIREQKVGVVFGLLSCTLNLGLGLTALVAPALMTLNWVLSIAWFIACSLFTLVAVVFFIVYDFRYNHGRLWSTKADRPKATRPPTPRAYPEVTGGELEATL
ncbi:major facilitator superfamily domain-containing protein 1-like [Carpediemonas membranifera]|uniref:Lysosomal dipeptide transporter MFSD1 n=1 Tax=Carpediemonas membranifera TaxID=201153 RepID=A0A8J6E4A8_9EUKA|nr:major facilitator superfamily domain-containing protein 1-like [Carpediemonas membranifera]|eukprot:KAG9396686.1 major facilitator superfamily domain-containing protein 1-like [Carpediemonas membranifera]